MAYPESTIMPFKIGDEIWHREIPDTDALPAAISEAILGRFLVHYPYLGMRNETEAGGLSDTPRRTLDLYRDAFG